MAQKADTAKGDAVDDAAQVGCGMSNTEYHGEAIIEVPEGEEKGLLTPHNMKGDAAVDDAQTGYAGDIEVDHGRTVWPDGVAKRDCLKKMKSDAHLLNRRECQRLRRLREYELRKKQGDHSFHENVNDSTEVVCELRMQQSSPGLTHRVSHVLDTEAASEPSTDSDLLISMKELHIGSRFRTNGDKFSWFSFNFRTYFPSRFFSPFHRLPAFQRRRRERERDDNNVPVECAEGDEFGSDANLSLAQRSQRRRRQRERDALEHGRRVNQQNERELRSAHDVERENFADLTPAQRSQRRRRM
ncbi:hypothetical protein EDB85DRAFT_2187719 [Lactarius pseudohatsudake]|nr:hypothetical protein EDB85DRAFT_1900188 [Lactarius pseudohatsudake]KAH9018077.1 hypothetical protein EDB85DRAFT_1897360 [Lactarius pseudohatsudake]KAH9021993.1 hypothetical protein EDB85DRAFT_2187719 [Lactarius pseudohatsudake]